MHTERLQIESSQKKDNPSWAWKDEGQGQMKRQEDFIPSEGGVYNHITLNVPYLVKW
jgi:hypothetical protein